MIEQVATPTLTRAERTRVVAVPCFSGAPWELARFPKLADRYALTTLRLPDGEDDLGRYADAVLATVPSSEPFVLMGDSFGAVVSLEAALRRPPGLRALVLSGGFAADPNTSLLGRTRAWFGAHLPRALYRSVTLRAHAAALASPHDADGDVALRCSQTADYFREHTSWESYTARLRAIRGIDLRERLREVDVPALVLSPSYDALVGRQSTDALVAALPAAEELVLEGTGHMLRFTHPARYEEAVLAFLGKLR